MGKMRPTWGSLDPKTGSGYVPHGTTKSWWSGEVIQEFVEHDCNPPATAKGSWRCGCGREWVRTWP